MILVDSVYINDGGGLVLLKYLVKTLTSLNIEAFYLFDERTIKIFKDLDAEKLFIPNKLALRKNFYINNAYKFKSVLCFGNVPPPLKIAAEVYTYFHQPLFLKIPAEFTLKNKILYKIKQLILNYFINNTDKWLVQSELMSKEFSKKYLKGIDDTVQILPFYPPLNFNDDKRTKREKKSFLYVSNNAPHKNHENLIQAFCNAYDRTKEGSLTITVPSNAHTICNMVKDKIACGYPIVNLGFIDRSDLAKIYLTNEFLIFPSFAESFGLGLAEAIDGGCKVLVSNLPYAYQVCNPSLTFNPYTVASIEDAIIKAVTQDLPDSIKIISNDINQLILLLSE